MLATWIAGSLLLAGTACTQQPAAPSASTSAVSIPEIVKNVEPSVVTIRTPEGLGSGVVYKADGTIVTDAHVVKDQRQQPFKTVQVQFADGSQADATVVGVDNPTDVAVLKAPRTGLPAATFATAEPEVGPRYSDRVAAGLQ